MSQSSNKEGTRRIAISTFPTSLTLAEFSKLEIDPGARIMENMQTQGKRGSRAGNFLLAIGCKDGKTVMYKFNLGTYSGQYLPPLYVTRGGVGYGAITAVNIQDTAENMICSTESGELV